MEKEINNTKKSKFINEDNRNNPPEETEFQMSNDLKSSNTRFTESTTMSNNNNKRHSSILTSINFSSEMMNPKLETGLKRPSLIFTNLNDFICDLLSFSNSTQENTSSFNPRSHDFSIISKKRKGNNPNEGKDKVKLNQEEIKQKKLLEQTMNKIIEKSNTNLSFIIDPSIISSNSMNMKNNIKNLNLKPMGIENSGSSRGMTIYSSKSHMSNLSNVSNLSNFSNLDLDNSYDIFMKFRTPPPILKIITKFLEEPINNYIHHNVCFLEYDENEVFIFIFKTNIYITKFLDDNELSKIDSTNFTKESFVLHTINYMNLFHYELIVTEDTEDYNSVILQFFENDYKDKSEL